MGYSGVIYIFEQRRAHTSRGLGKTSLYDKWTSLDFPSLDGPERGNWCV